MIWFTSDLHFNHNREFIWKARGFANVKAMNTAIVERYNSLVEDEDEVYILGDLMFGQDQEDNISLIKQLKGNKFIIRGNHDSNARVDIYMETLNIPVFDALHLKANGYNFYLSHYPTITLNGTNEIMRQAVLNLYGHTHQTSNFYNDIPFMYHVGVDSHCCYPVSIDQVIQDMAYKVKECRDLL